MRNRIRIWDIILWILTGWPLDNPRLGKWGSIVETSHNQRRSRRDGSCPPTRGWWSTGTPMPTSTLWRLCHTKRNGMAFWTQDICINFTSHSTIPTLMSDCWLACHSWAFAQCHSATRYAPRRCRLDANGADRLPPKSLPPRLGLQRARLRLRPLALLATRVKKEIWLLLCFLDSFHLLPYLKQQRKSTKYDFQPLFMCNEKAINTMKKNLTRTVWLCWVEYYQFYFLCILYFSALKDWLHSNWSTPVTEPPPTPQPLFHIGWPCCLCYLGWVLDFTQSTL